MRQKIVTLGNRVLRDTAESVPTEDIGTKKINDIIKKMSDALASTEDGIGIAAPQIGVPLRIFLASGEALAIDAGENPDSKKKKRDWDHYVFINPEIVKQSGKKITATEGCLSVPKKYGLVPRSAKIRIRALNEQGKKFERGASHLFARLLQHELDHLNGILYIDRAKKVVEIP